MPISRQDFKRLRQVELKELTIGNQSIIMPANIAREAFEVLHELPFCTGPVYVTADGEFNVLPAYSLIKATEGQRIVSLHPITKVTASPELEASFSSEKDKELDAINKLCARAENLLPEGHAVRVMLEEYFSKVSES